MITGENHTLSGPIYSSYHIKNISKEKLLGEGQVIERQEENREEKEHSLIEKEKKNRTSVTHGKREKKNYKTNLIEENVQVPEKKSPSKSDHNQGEVTDEKNNATKPLNLRELLLQKKSYSNFSVPPNPIASSPFTREQGLLANLITGNLKNKSEDIRDRDDSHNTGDEEKISCETSQMKRPGSGKSRYLKHKGKEHSYLFSHKEKGRKEFLEYIRSKKNREKSSEKEISDKERAGSDISGTVRDHAKSSSPASKLVMTSSVLHAGKDTGRGTRELNISELDKLPLKEKPLTDEYKLDFCFEDKQKKSLSSHKLDSCFKDTQEKSFPDGHKLDACFKEKQEESLITELSTQQNRRGVTRKLDRAEVSNFLEKHNVAQNPSTDSKNGIKLVRIDEIQKNFHRSHENFRTRKLESSELSYKQMKELMNRKKERFLSGKNSEGKDRLIAGENEKILRKYLTGKKQGNDRNIDKKQIENQEIQNKNKTTLNSVTVSESDNKQTVSETKRVSSVKLTEEQKKNISDYNNSLSTTIKTGEDLATAIEQHFVLTSRNDTWQKIDKNIKDLEAIPDKTSIEKENLRTLKSQRGKLEEDEPLLKSPELLEEKLDTLDGKVTELKGQYNKNKDITKGFYNKCIDSLPEAQKKAIKESDSIMESKTISEDIKSRQTNCLNKKKELSNTLYELDEKRNKQGLTADEKRELDRQYNDARAEYHHVISQETNLNNDIKSQEADYIKIRKENERLKSELGIGNPEELTEEQKKTYKLADDIYAGDLYAKGDIIDRTVTSHIAKKTIATTNSKETLQYLKDTGKTIETGNPVTVAKEVQGKAISEASKDYNSSFHNTAGKAAQLNTLNHKIDLLEAYKNTNDETYLEKYRESYGSINKDNINGELGKLKDEKKKTQKEYETSLKITEQNYNTMMALLPPEARKEIDGKRTSYQKASQQLAKIQTQYKQRVENITNKIINYEAILSDLKNKEPDNPGIQKIENTIKGLIQDLNKENNSYNQAETNLIQMRKDLNMTEMKYGVATAEVPDDLSPHERQRYGLCNSMYVGTIPASDNPVEDAINRSNNISELCKSSISDTDLLNAKFSGTTITVRGMKSLGENGIVEGYTMGNKIVLNQNAPVVTLPHEMSHVMQNNNFSVTETQQTQIESLYEKARTNPIWDPPPENDREYYALGLTMYDNPEQRGVLAQRDPGLYNLLKEQEQAGMLEDKQLQNGMFARWGLNAIDKGDPAVLAYLEKKTGKKGQELRNFLNDMVNDMPVIQGQSNLTYESYRARLNETGNDPNAIAMALGTNKDYLDAYGGSTPSPSPSTQTKQITPKKENRPGSNQTTTNILNNDQNIKPYIRSKTFAPNTQGQSPDYQTSSQIPTGNTMQTVQKDSQNPPVNQGQNNQFQPGKDQSSSQFLSGKSDTSDGTPAQLQRDNQRSQVPVQTDKQGQQILEQNNQKQPVKDQSYLQTIKAGEGSVNEKEEYAHSNEERYSDLTKEEKLSGLTTEEKSIGMTKDEKQAGMTKDEKEAGMTKDEKQAGMTKDEKQAGMTKDEKEAGMTKDEKQAGMTKDEKQAGMTKDEKQAGMTKDEKQAGMTKDEKQAGMTKDEKQAGMTKDEKQAGMTKDEKQTGMTKDEKQTGMTKDEKQTGMTKDEKQTGMTKDEKQTGMTKDEKQTGITKDEKQAGMTKDEKQAGMTKDEKQAGMTKDEKQAGMTKDEKQAGMTKDEKQTGMTKDEKQTGMTKDEKQTGMTKDEKQTGITKDEKISAGRGEKSVATPKDEKTSTVKDAKSATTPKDEKISAGREEKSVATPKDEKTSTVKDAKSAATPKDEKTSTVKDAKSAATPKDEKTSTVKDAKSAATPKDEKTSTVKDAKSAATPKDEKISAGREEKSVATPKDEKTSTVKDAKSAATPKDEKISAGREEKSVATPKDEKTSTVKDAKSVTTPKDEKISTVKDAKSVTTPKDEKISAVRGEKSVIIPKEEKAAVTKPDNNLRNKNTETGMKAEQSQNNQGKTGDRENISIARPLKNQKDTMPHIQTGNQKPEGGQKTSEQKPTQTGDRQQIDLKKEISRQISVNTEHVQIVKQQGKTYETGQQRREQIAQKEKSGQEQSGNREIIKNQGETKKQNIQSLNGVTQGNPVRREEPAKKGEHKDFNADTSGKEKKNSSWTKTGELPSKPSLVSGTREIANKSTEYELRKKEILEKTKENNNKKSQITLNTQAKQIRSAQNKPAQGRPVKTVTAQLNTLPKLNIVSLKELSERNQKFITPQNKEITSKTSGSVKEFEVLKVRSAAGMAEGTLMPENIARRAYDALKNKPVTERKIMEIKMSASINKTFKSLENKPVVQKNVLQLLRERTSTTLSAIGLFRGNNLKVENLKQMQSRIDRFSDNLSLYNKGIFVTEDDIKKRKKQTGTYDPDIEQMASWDKTKYVTTVPTEIHSDSKLQLLRQCQMCKTRVGVDIVLCPACAKLRKNIYTEIKLVYQKNVPKNYFTVTTPEKTTDLVELSMDAAQLFKKGDIEEIATYRKRQIFPKMKDILFLTKGNTLYTGRQLAAWQGTT